MLTPLTRQVALLCLLACLASAGPALAETFVFSTAQNTFDPGVLNQGWYASGANHIDANDNYVAGLVNGSEHRNFFSFNVGALSGTPISATLQVTGGSSTSNPLTYELFEVLIDAATVNDNSSFRSFVFGDLGSGPSYGSYVFDPMLSSSHVSFLDLNAAALGAIDAARQGDGWFTIGGAIQDLQNGGWILSTASGTENFLVIEVPEPTTALLLLVAIGLACRTGWRRGPTGSLA